MPVPRQVALARSALANAVKDGAPPDQIEILRGDLQSANERAQADAAIDEIIARAPSLTPEQGAKLGRLFAYIDPAADR